MVKRTIIERAKIATAAILMGLLVCLAMPVAAQTEGDELSFEELIEAAKTSYEAEEYEEAIGHLLAANRQQPNARLLLNVAKSYEKTGDCVRAQVYYRAFVRDPGAEESLVPGAKKEIERADQCDGWDDLMSGRVIVESTPPGATVAVDGKEYGTTPLEVAGIMEGERVVSFALEGYERAEKRVDLVPDRDKTVEVELQEVQEVAEPEPEPEPQVIEPEGDSTSPVVHYAIAGGVAAVGIGLFTVGLLTDLGIPEKYDEPRQEPGITQAEFDRLTDERSSATTRALIFYIAGSALIAGGAGYGAYVAATSGTEEPSPRVGFTPSLGPDGAGFAFFGEF